MRSELSREAVGNIIRRAERAEEVLKLFDELDRVLSELRKLKKEGE